MDIKEKNILVNITPERIAKIIDFMVLLLYSIILFQSIIGFSVLQVEKVFIAKKAIVDALLILGLLKIFIFFDEDKVKAYAAISLILIVFLGVKTGYNDYSALGALMLSAYNLDFSKLARVHVATACVTLGMLFILSILGIVDDTTYFSDSRVVKYYQALGFFNHNQFMLFLFFAVLALFYLLYGKKRQIMYYTIMFLIIVICWNLTGCNTVMMVTTFVYFLLLLYFILVKYDSKVVRNIRKGVSFFLVGMPIYGVIITLIGLFLFGKYGYGEKLYSVRDRYGMLYNALEKLGVQMPINTIEAGSIASEVDFSLINGIGKGDYPGPEYFDILYGRLFILDGAVAVIIYIVITTFIMYRAYRYEQYNILIFMSAYVLLGYSESTAISMVPGNIGMMFLFASYKNLKFIDEV